MLRRNSAQGVSNELAGDGELAFCTGDGGAELRLVGSRDGEVEADNSDLLRERVWIGRGRLKVEQRAAFGRVRGRMKRIGRPLDEEGKQSAVVVFEIERFPLKDTAVGAFARARPWT